MSSKHGAASEALPEWPTISPATFFMRVLHIYSGNLYGGVETLLVTLARCRGLCPEMEPHYAICFEGRLKDELEEAGVPVHLLGKVRISRPWTVWQARNRCRELLNQERPDAVVCHSCWPHAIFAKMVRELNIPLIFWAHDIITRKHWLEWWAGRIKPDLVVANSRGTQSSLGNLFPATRSEVVYLPVATSALREHDSVRRQIRESLETPEGATVIIQASRLERWKGHHLLLEALAKLREVPPWACWIAGGAQRPHEQAYFQEVQAAATSLGLGERIRFLGQRGDVPRLLAAADIHCQPNIGPEPFGIAFVEALYAGLPVVTTALGGALEIVEDSCGVLVPPGNADCLANALGRLIREGELRKRLGAGGPKRARELCDPSQQLARLHEQFAASGNGG